MAAIVGNIKKIEVKKKPATMRKKRVFEAEKVVRQKKYMFAAEKSCSLQL